MRPSGRIETLARRGKNVERQILENALANSQSVSQFAMDPSNFGSGKAGAFGAFRHGLPDSGRHLPSRLRARRRPVAGPHCRVRSTGRTRRPVVLQSWHGHSHLKPRGHSGGRKNLGQDGQSNRKSPAARRSPCALRRFHQGATGTRLEREIFTHRIHRGHRVEMAFHSPGRLRRSKIVTPQNSAGRSQAGGRNGVKAQTVSGSVSSNHGCFRIRGRTAAGRSAQSYRR